MKVTRHAAPLSAAVAIACTSIVLAATAVASAGSVAVAAGAPAAAARRQVTAYVLNNGAGTVTPINTVTNKAGKPIHLKGRPDYFEYVIEVTPDGKTVYAAGPAAGEMSPISTATNRAGEPMWVGGPVPGPDGFAGATVFTPDSKKAYVLDVGIEDTITHTVTPINTVTNEAGTPINVGSSPGGIVITPNGKTVYVVSGRGMVPIDTATNNVGTAIKVGPQPSTIVITPDSKTAYVLDYGRCCKFQGMVRPVRLATGEVGRPIRVGFWPWGIVMTPNGKTVYAFSSRGIVPINTATKKAGKAIKVFGSFDAITPNGKTLYVVNTTGTKVTTVTPISTATNKPGKAIRISGANPLDMAITPNGKTLYLVIDSEVIPINTTTNKAGKPIKVGTSPTGIAITP